MKKLLLSVLFVLGVFITLNSQINVNSSGLTGIGGSTQSPYILNVEGISRINGETVFTYDSYPPVIKATPNGPVLKAYLTNLSTHVGSLGTSTNPWASVYCDNLYETHMMDNNKKETL